MSGREEFVPLLRVHYGEKQGEPWLEVWLTTDVAQDNNFGYSSRAIYNGPAPEIAHSVAVVSAELP